MTEFECITYGKWILSGEHSVLRGHPALVFPIHNCFLKTQYFDIDQDLEVDFSGSSKEEYHLLFWGVMEEALKRVYKQRSDLTGKLIIQSGLPLGAGLGASAALCVSLAKLLVHKKWLSEPEIYEFSRSLEDLFHGESSGVDIAVALEGSPMRFLRSGERTPIRLSWQPKWYISYSGQRGVTSECVNKVKALMKSDSSKAEKLDLQMKSSVEKAENALQLDEDSGVAHLMEAVRLGESCFTQWGLIEGSLKEHIQVLKASGAMACKPTGSGGGGYVLSLWSENPPDPLRESLIPLGPFY